MTGQPKRKCLLIGADSFADAKPALRIAEALLSLGIGDIGGIFVENPQSVEAWPAHAQCVVTTGGSLCVAPTMAQQKQMFERDAKAFRQDLARIAGRSTIAWKFDRDQGDPVRQSVLAAEGWDMLMIGHRRLGRQTGCVISIQTEGPEAERTRMLSEDLSRVLRTRTVAIRDPQPETALLTSINRTCGVVVVVDAVAGPIRDTKQLRRLLEAARCPVLILGNPALREGEDE